LGFPLTFKSPTEVGTLNAGLILKTALRTIRDELAFK
jgi:hypothetical protein